VRGRILRIAAAALVAVAGLARADYGDDAELADRDPDYAAARKALEAKNYGEAVKRLATVALREPGNADVHNLLGFSHRNLGSFALAFEHYGRALRIDPRHKGAHEYIGQTYLKVGDLGGAEKHLAELQRLCPMSCEQLKDLERAIAEFKGRK
jgi:Flp pilus assembly protein TadD